MKCWRLVDVLMLSELDLWLGDGDDYIWLMTCEKKTFDFCEVVACAAGVCVCVIRCFGLALLAGVACTNLVLGC